MRAARRREDLARFSHGGSTAPTAAPSNAEVAIPTGFIRDAARSYGDPQAESLLIHAENLDAMRRLASAGFAHRFRCIYFDPPFNSGRCFVEYRDSQAPEVWRMMIRDRIAAARPLLADDGALAIEIDDTELGPLQVTMDDVFGRKQRISTITVVRSAATGHKAANRGPVNVTDFLLVYAKDRERWRCNSLLRERQKYDNAYASWVENPHDPPQRWRFTTLVANVRRALGREPSRAEVEGYAVAHADHVVRFAQPRYEAVSREARALIDQSRREPMRVFHLERVKHKSLVLRGGNRILTLADKVVDRGGRRVLVEPLTNVWDDVPFQGIAREGGARFVRNKKPERLVERIIAISTEPGDWVLDAYLGSGTTAAVAHKLGRRWVGIERGDHLDALCIPRLRRVVDGEDSTGVTRAHGWKGGGGFHVCT